MIKRYVEAYNFEGMSFKDTAVLQLMSTTVQ